MATVNMTIANYFDNGDRYGFKYLFVLVSKMNPELCGDNYQMECLEYI